MRAIAATLVLVSLALPARSFAYTIKRTESGTPIRWSAGRIGVHVHRSLADRYPEARAAALIAADAWRGYGGPELVVDPAIDSSPLGQGEGTQIALLDEWTYAPHLLAVTVTSRTEDGEILDADIMVNAEHAFALLDERAPDAARFDLGAVLTHETGHVLGLGESDADPMATMWPRIRPGDTFQRTLADDDVEGLSEAYRGAMLAPVSGCGSASVAGRGATPAWALVVLAIVAVLRRRSAGSTAIALAAGLLVMSAATSRGDASREGHHGLRSMLAPFEGAVAGRAHVLGVGRDARGLVETRVEVEGVELSLPGGCIDGVCQRVGDSAPPVEGELLLVAQTGAWARIAGGVAYDGWLEGSAVRLAE